MRIAEQVTFGGGGALDRRAELRGDSVALGQFWADPLANVLLLWRGKVLAAGADSDACQLAAITGDHVVIRDRFEGSLFLGVEAGRPCFAVDISDWEPEALPDTLDAFTDPSLQTHPDLPQGTAFAELRGIMSRATPAEAERAAMARALMEWHRTHGFCARCGAKSDMVQAGWQRTCPACGGQHFPRTDPVVIMLITRGDRLLLGRSPGWPEKMYSLLAGFVEPGETIEAAVRREVAEESGIRVGAVGYLASQPWPFPASLMIGCHGEALSDDITLDPNELEDAIWVTRNELADAFAGRSDMISPARRGAIAQFLMWNWLADRLD